MLVLTVVIAISTTCYTKYAKRQWRVMRDQLPELHTSAEAAKSAADIDRIALESVQRPFVTFPPEVRAIAVVDAGKKLKRWSFYLPVENSGNTTAQPMRMRFNFDGQGNTELTAYPDRGNSASVPVVLGPKARLWSEALDVSPNVIEKVKRKKARLFFYGWACYRDSFPKTKVHITEFCWEVPYFQATPINGGYEITTSLSSCRQHVCADDGCKEKPDDSTCSD
jgi:hypothetical protein